MGKLASAIAHLAVVGALGGLIGATAPLVAPSCRAGGGAVAGPAATAPAAPDEAGIAERETALLGEIRGLEEAWETAAPRERHTIEKKLQDRLDEFNELERRRVRAETGPDAVRRATGHTGADAGTATDETGTAESGRASAAGENASRSISSG